jgi:hypothetical protein
MDVILTPEFLANLPDIVGRVVGIDWHGQNTNIRVRPTPLCEFCEWFAECHHIAIPICVNKDDAALVADRGISLRAARNAYYWFCS